MHIYTTLAVYSSPRSALFFFERPSAAVAGTFRFLSTVAPFRPFLEYIFGVSPLRVVCDERKEVKEGTV